MKLSELLIEPEVTLELAPLIDVLFLIVLFYAVSSSLISPEDLAQLKRQFAATTIENQTLTERTEAQRLNLAQLQTDLTASREDAAGRAARLAQLQGELQAGAAQLTQRAAELAEARGRLGQLQTDLAATQGQVGERDRRVNEQAARLAALKADLDVRDAALAAKEQALAAQAQRIVIMDQSLADVRSQLAQSQSGADQQARQMAAAQAGLAKLEADSRQLADDLRKEKAAHEADQAAAKSEIDRLRIQIDTLTAENTRFEAAKKAEQDRSAGVVENQKRLSESLKSLIEDKSLGVARVNDRLVLELSDKTLFDSGSETLRPEGLPVLANVAKVLASKVQNLQIQVGGHTDNVPLGSANRFGSNWALSAARAVNVVRFFEQTGGVDPSRLAAVGFGEFQPIAANTTPEGRSRNRRIEIVLLAK